MREKILVLIFFLIFTVSNLWAAEVRYNLPVENSPFLGNETAPVTIIEFIDYQ